MGKWVKGRAVAALLPLLSRVVSPCSAARCFSCVSLRFNLLSSYNGLQVLQSNCPHAMWKMATASSRSTYAQPEGVLKLSGLGPADCPALGISGNLMSSSLGVRCEKPMIWPVSLLHVGVNVGSSYHQPPTVSAWVSGLWDPEAVKLPVWSCWCTERGGLFCLFLTGYSSSCWMVMVVLILFFNLDYDLITAVGLWALISVQFLDSQKAIKHLLKCLM